MIDDDQGTMHAQPDLSNGLGELDVQDKQPTTDGVVEGSDDKRNAAEKAQERAAQDSGLMNQDPTRAKSSDPAARDEELASLRAQLKEAQDRVDAITKAAKPMVKTVTAEEPPEAAIPAAIPRTFVGQMDPDAKALLKKAGIGVTKIVLEESDSIPPTGLFIGHNGRSYMLKPGEEADVPDFLLSVLDDAIMAQPITDPATQKILGYRSRSKYPYRVVK